ncbi:glycerophosphodiester phosphodiesterase [Clostridium sp. BJN0001]|uniref:glycerophosphodiester phosphodiesterase n=1 Tax=Clostridium sp. BJN0001 TaxID=2930219 RepID=UPI001FD59375|nr:glycerophosphodiester phosphodiesterase [Clostridium sp. BJN0001]
MSILNIAHRGYSGRYDENTMLAFKKAYEYKADGIETDVQLSKDGIPVIMHDEKLDRTTDKKGFLKDYTLDELKKINILKKHDEYEIDERIPTLEELLCFFSKTDMKVLNLELKNSIIDYDGLEEKVLDLIEKYKIKDRIIISSFNHVSLVRFRKLDKDVMLGALTDSTLAYPEEYLKKIDVECYHPYFYSILNKEYTERIIKRGIQINPYTVNDLFDMKKVINLKVNSIITNEVEKLNKLLKSN